MDHNESKLIHASNYNTEHGENITPIFLSSGFNFSDSEQMRATFANEIDRNIYSRFTNPNFNEFIEKLALLEEVETGVAFATGMAAVFATFAAHCNAGDHIVSARSIFGSTHSVFTTVFPRWNIQVTQVPLNDFSAWEQAIQPNTKFLYVETPTNPGIEIVNLQTLADLAHSKGIFLVVDNCFATPIVQVPSRFGADLIIHSATKFIDGQGRVLGGAVLGSQQLIEPIAQFLRHTGPTISPFNAWLLARSLDTLPVRMEKHSANALVLAEFLEQHSEIEWVKYPFLKSHSQYETAKQQMLSGGGMLAFELKGGLNRGRNFLNALKMCILTANLGDVKTIVTHPASTTHSKLSEHERQLAGITNGMIRVSVGLEHVNDIIQDIQQAIEASK